MPFPQKLLNDGEEVIVDVRPHVWVLAFPIFLALLAVAGGVAAAVSGAPTTVKYLLVVVLLVVLVYLLARWVRWRSISLVVTDQRLIHRSGVVSRSGREIPLTQLSDITYHQTLFDRLIGAGDMSFESSAHDSDEQFDSVPHPAVVQNEIYQLMAACQPRGGAAAGRSLSVPEQIEKLAALRRQGALSDGEFASAKARLLGEIGER